MVRVGRRASLLAVVLMAAACGPAAGAGQGQPVNVLYAGSLAELMESDLGPAFDAATGYQFVGVAGGSSELASQIKGGLRRADVFVSASPGVDRTLQGRANGDWVSWYSTFATGALVLGYNPKSSFASRLLTQPWYQVVAEPGFRLGRTDPALDPKGQLSAAALDQAAAMFHLPALARAASSVSGVFPEETLVGRLEAGQLDAGLLYANEAREAGIPTVALGSLHLGATYTATVVNRAPDQAGAVAFVAYLLGQGRAVLRGHGLDAVTPALAGSVAAVPAGLRRLVSGS